MCPALRVEEIRREESFRKLGEAWNQLADASSQCVFLRHEWFSAAWQWRRTDAALRMLCVFRGEELVGILPSVAASSRWHVGRTLAFLAVPDTQCCDILARPEHQHAVCEALVDHLMRYASEWDELHLDHLLSHSVAATCLTPLLAARATHCELVANDRNPFIDLQGTWEEYHHACTRSVKKAFNLAANRLAKNGCCVIERITSDSGDLKHALRLLNDTIVISANSWKRGTGYTLDANTPCAFVRHLTRSAHANGWLSLWILRIHGKPAAMEYQLLHGRDVYALRADFDEEYRNLSPGSYLSRYLLQELFGQGLNRYYLGPGANSYKARWSKTGESLHALQAYSPTLRAHALALWPQEVKHKLSSLKDQVTSVLAGPPK